MSKVRIVEDETGLERFTPEQIKTMWDACMPKVEPTQEMGDIYITGTAETQPMSSDWFTTLDFSKKKKMSKNKYYTPTIEEFHIGFEYQYLANSMVYVEDDVWDGKGEGLDFLFKHNKIRVKYLDQEDIESLGFKILDYDNMDSFTNEDIDIEVNGYTDPLIVEIWTRKNMVNRSVEMVFKGTIRNKSELKKVLKQIDYGV
jgi:hypothetical protein